MWIFVFESYTLCRSMKFRYRVMVVCSVVMCSLLRNWCMRCYDQSKGLRDLRTCQFGVSIYEVSDGLNWVNFS